MTPGSSLLGVFFFGWGQVSGIRDSRLFFYWGKAAEKQPV